ncbi:alpha/beta hydrolase [Arsenicitalea aurantiaca]|uniref:Alpha/beta hydrolase n=1 Tax=Arsenicitalea aurantiaca TaxID=1783274 RepID=A0A433XG46_9HYPH|nr:alpha/beta hydrolase [Arsenicitalea aurantiaca]RUT33055.1 alpha/beta hydrolase [Arsenicitalea aurantiaca]
MAQFTSDGVEIAYEIHGEGRPILLIHGFGSSAAVNWVGTGWVETLTGAGYQAIALDNRGHGKSQKLHDPAAYTPAIMADDAVALLDHLGIETLPVMGYSMGARIAAFLAHRHAGRASAMVWGGMGMNLVTGLGDSETIIAALLAPTLSEVTDPIGRQFRIFAEHTGSDREALAACMATSRAPLAESAVREIEVPVLVAIGADDVMAGDPQKLADLLPRGEAFVIPRRDHMRATGDPAFRQAALDFLARNDQ